MLHGLITSGDYVILDETVLSLSRLIDSTSDEHFSHLTNSILAKRSFPVSNDSDVFTSLFALANNKFSEVFGSKKDIACREGYIALDYGDRPALHNEKSRVFTDMRCVYFDYLMSDVLFSYAASYYLWAKHQNNPEVSSFCFRYILYTFEECCRKGNLSNAEGKEVLLKMMDDYLERYEFERITSLYWCMIAFAFCHELAHVYLEHGAADTLSASFFQESQADATGYDIFLQIMLDRSRSASPTDTQKIFHESLFTAPMILLLFYQGLFSTCYRLYDETVVASHPYESDRIQNLIDISMDEKYDFDNNAGLIILYSFLDVHDWFQEELFYKTKNGKLQSIIRKKDNRMTGKGYEEALQFSNATCEAIKAYALEIGQDPDRLVGIWNSTVYIDTGSMEEAKNLIFPINRSLYSTKVPNIRFNLGKLLLWITESKLTMSPPTTKIEILKTSLYIVFGLTLHATIQFSDVEAEVLLYCHKASAYNGIDEHQVLDAVPKANSETLDRLSHIGCIHIQDAKVFLAERILFQ